MNENKTHKYYIYPSCSSAYNVLWVLVFWLPSSHHLREFKSQLLHKVIFLFLRMVEREESSFIYFYFILVGPHGMQYLSSPTRD